MRELPAIDEIRVQSWLSRHGQGGPHATNFQSFARALVATRLPADANEGDIDLAIDLIDNPDWLAVRTLPDGRFAGVMPQLFGEGRLGVDHPPGHPVADLGLFAACWSYTRAVDAIAALNAWDPIRWPEPPGFSYRPNDGPRIGEAIVAS